MKFLNLLSPNKTNESDSHKSTLIFEENYLIVGEQYECRKDPKKKRLNVLKKMKPGQTVLVEEYKYQGKPAFMIVDPKSNLDLGVLSAGAAEYISYKCKGAEIKAQLTSRFEKSFHVDIMIFK